MTRGRIFAFYLIALLASCKRDPVILPHHGSEDCFDFIGVVPFSGGASWPGKDTGFNVPKFNPANANEIIYFRVIYSSQTGQVVKRNMLTGSETFFVENLWSKPEWSIRDWIVFNRADNQVWKMKSNGDSLTQLTTQGGLDAIWNYSGDKIAYHNQIGQSVTTDYTFVTDVNGIVMDTLFFPFRLHHGAWSNDNSMIAFNDFGLNIQFIDLGTLQITTVTNNSPDPANQGRENIMDIDWMPDSQSIIWVNGFGIFRTNIQTKQTTKIVTSCDSKRYETVSVSPNGDKIIVSRRDRKVSNDTMYSKTGLSLINIDGGAEIKIK